MLFLEGLVMAHSSLIVQEREWHLYPGRTTGCFCLRNYLQKTRMGKDVVQGTEKWLD